MAIELTPQKKPRRSLFTTITGIVAVFLVVAFVGSYLYFYITNKGLVEKVDKIKEDSKELDKSIRDKEEELLIFRRRISDFSSLISGHKNVGIMFDFINENTIPTVWFNEFQYDEKEEGSFLIGQQIVVFRNQDLVKDTRLTDVSIDEENGLIDFSINIALSPEAFAFREQVDSLLEVETPTQ